MGSIRLYSGDDGESHIEAIDPADVSGGGEAWDDCAPMVGSPKRSG